MLRSAGRPEQVFGMTFGAAELALRGGSFAVLADRRGRHEVWRLMDRGARCAARVAEADPDNFRHVAIGIGGGRLMWGTADAWADGPFSRMMLTDVELAGRCGRSPIGLVAGRRPIPEPTAVALDGRWLYYASDRGVHRRRLPARGSTARPANDDVADALAIRIAPEGSEPRRN